MDTLQFRPRFKFYSELGVGEVSEKITHFTENQTNAPIRISKIFNHLVLYFPKDQREFWTPQMDINLEKEEGKTLVRCLIGPPPAIWTMVVFIYGSLALVIMFAGIFWFSNVMLGISSLAYIPVIFAAFLMIAVFFGVKHYQKKSYQQMTILKEYLDQAIGCDCYAKAVQY